MIGCDDITPAGGAMSLARSIGCLLLAVVGACAPTPTPVPDVARPVSEPPVEAPAPPPQTDTGGSPLPAMTAQATAPGQQQPRCAPLPVLPGSPPDAAADTARRGLCAIDFSQPDTAVCPKNWSTSPAALVYDLKDTSWSARAADFERQVCPRGTSARSEARRELAVFKHSMNSVDSSATYAPAALLYDHLSRWLGMRVRVPVAVRQQFPLDWYGRRVVEPGLKLATTQGSSDMLRAGWQRVADVLAAPEANPLAAEMIAADGTAVWGASLLFTGRRYGPEVNGTRASGWGSGQNRDFQQTAPFLLLRDPQPLEAATRRAIAAAREDPAMAAALPEDTDPLQVQWWAGEVLEIVVLDYLLGQQDRIGNIDYQWRWLWWQDSGFRSVPADAGASPPAQARRLRVSWLNDNDAGVRRSYTDFAERTGMLQGLRRFDPGLYLRVRELAADFATRGSVFQAMAANYGLHQGDLEAIARRLKTLDGTLRRDCLAGYYRFDLSPLRLLTGVDANTEKPACD